MNQDFQIDGLLARMAAFEVRSCLHCDGKTWTYADLSERIRSFRKEFAKRLDDDGNVGLVADYSIGGIAALLALWAESRCVALLPRGSYDDKTYHEAGHIACLVRVLPDGSVEFGSAGRGRSHPLLEQLSARSHPGMVLFTSGSSGQPKAVLHDVNRFLLKYSKPGKQLSTYAFLVFDHVAGQDTLLYTLSAGGELVAGPSRRPEVVAELIDKHSVQVLPASPTFLNLLILSGAADRYDLDSVEIITYGSEPIDEGTLSHLSEIFPNTRIIQKYGTSEFGAIRSISKSSDSTFIQIKKDETDYRVIDGILWIRSRGAMLGYLNAPSGLDEEGWLCTGDVVEQDGEWLRILGRESDIINVGGEKVFPAEVESIVMQLDFVHDCTVRGEPQPIIGMAVTCEAVVDPDIVNAPPANRRKLARAIRQKCREHLPDYKVPVRIDFITGSAVTERQKKIRRT